MTDEELAAIRTLWHTFRRVELYRGDPVRETALKDELVNHVPALLAEVERYREIVQAVAHGTLAHYEDDTPYCLYCTQEYRYPTGITHTPACPVTKARALLGEKEATER